MVVGALGCTSKKLKNCIEELGVVITAENSTTRDNLYIKKGFRLWIRFMEIGVEGGKRKKWERGGGEKRIQKLNM